MGVLTTFVFFPFQTKVPQDLAFYFLKGAANEKKLKNMNLFLHYLEELGVHHCQVGF